MKLNSVIAARSDKTVYRDGDRRVKVFGADYSKQDVLNEALNQARVEETGLNVPRILEVTMVNGKWAIVTEFIEGQTLSKLMAENPERMGEYIDLLVDIQLQIHAKVCPLLGRLKDKLNRKIMFTDLDATSRYDLHIRLEAMPKHNKVCHGDFHPANIIIAENGTPYIIDWSHAAQGNASADAAITYINLKLSGNEQDAQMYLDTFCEKSGIPKENVRKWIPIAAAAQSLTATEQDKATLLSWANEE